MNPYLVLVLSLLFLIFSESNAFAWGPFMHYDIGNGILAEAAGLALAVRYLLLRFPEHFLYGNLAADFVIAKNLAAPEAHSHRWSNAFNLYKQSSGDSERAFALGYLCHLASDVSAHNSFVPAKIIESFETPMTLHSYWEMRIDSLVSPLLKSEARVLLRYRFHGNDELFRDTIKCPIMNFPLNKGLIKGAYLFQSSKPWQMITGHINGTSRNHLNPNEKEEMYLESLRNSLSLLEDLEQSTIVNIDPRGEDPIYFSLSVRRALHKAKRRRYFSASHFDELKKDFRNSLNGIFHPPYLFTYPDISLHLRRMREQAAALNNN